MRRKVSLMLSLLVVAGGATAASVATADAATPLAVPHAAIKAAAGSQCHPTAMYCWKPATRSIPSKGKIIWKNTTIAPHNVTRCSAVPCSGVNGGTGTDTGLGSANFGSGGKYTFKFTGKGTYNFYCTVHGYALMHGTVTVT